MAVRTIHFCNGDKCCPVVKRHDNTAPISRRIEIADDFGGSARMSKRQFFALVKAAKKGEFDKILR